MDPVLVRAMFDKYMFEAGNYFNQKQDTTVKIGHFRIIWDNIITTDKHVGEVLERISQARSVCEYTHKPQRGINHTYKYTDVINESRLVIEEQHAAEAVEQLENLMGQWQDNAAEFALVVIDVELKEPNSERIFDGLVSDQFVSQSI